MLKLFEINGRGWSHLSIALPGQFHSRLRKFSTLNEPATALHRKTGHRSWGNRVGGPLARSVRPSSRAEVGAQKHRRGCW
jgi:hypothetical protein